MRPAPSQTIAARVLFIIPSISHPRWQNEQFTRDIGSDSSEVFLFAYAADSRDVRADFEDFMIAQR
jgi:hypothetical protein